MRAIGIQSDSRELGANALIDLDMTAPVPEARDLLVRVEAVSVNPLDIRMRRARSQTGGPRILGWDAAGTVVGVGSAVTLFQPGDRVFYAGSINRPGTNAELHLVDERIAGSMPATLDFAQAAALPLASLAAWEALFERLGIPKAAEDTGKTLLVIGGAGGVGSIAIQLAKVVAGLRVIATGSHDASQAWCRQLGADLVIDHGVDLAPQLVAHGIGTVDYILCLATPDRYFSTMARLIAPQGHICALVESAGALPMNELRAKSASFSWEGMFTRSLYNTHDVIEQHHILNRVAGLVDAGHLRHTAQTVLHPINADNLRQAHALLEAGGIVGKVVLSAKAQS
ncbi:MAG: zinc-binding alcohol dehydrogenase family protein [Burkholderiaceae bacterium]